MADPPFYTISSNGMQPQCPAASKIHLPRTHDTSQSVYHVNSICEFAATLDKAAKSAFPNQTHGQLRYRDVQVVLIQWENDGGLGVGPELEDLDKAFKRSFGFQTTTWLIPEENSLMDITSKTIDLVQEHGSEDKLLIIYYAGHGRMNDARQQEWLRTGRDNEGLLEWWAIQPHLLNCKSDVLFLLDCCTGAGAATASPTARGAKETIAACGFESTAPEPGAHSFTSELIDVLNKWRYKLFTVAMLHSELVSNLKHPKPKPDMFGAVVELRRTPVYYVTTSNPHARNIQLSCLPPPTSDPTSVRRPRKRQRVVHPSANPPEPTDDDSESSMNTPATSEDDGESCAREPKSIEKYGHENLNDVLPGGDLIIPHVLVSLALEGEQFLDVAAWNKWLSGCPSFARYARVEGMFKSHSTLLLLSIPLVIWDLLPDHFACSFIAYVSSVNHIKDASKPNGGILDLLLQKGCCEDGDLPTSDLPQHYPRPPSKQYNSKKSSNTYLSAAIPPRNQQEQQPTFDLNRGIQEPVQERLFQINDSISNQAIPNKIDEFVSFPSQEIMSATEIGACEYSRDQEGISSTPSIVSWRVEKPSVPETTIDLDNMTEEEQNVLQPQASEDFCVTDPVQEISDINGDGLAKADQLLRIEVKDYKQLPTSNIKDPGYHSEFGVGGDIQTFRPSLAPSDTQIYRPLGTEGTGFRLVSLHPGSAHNDIQCSLSHCTLNLDNDECPPYEALSYFWGSSERTATIQVDGYDFKVTKNLFEALHALRQEDSPRNLWIDAICIDQRNIAERGSQVMLMRSIYSNALQVLCWLGPELSTTAEALKCLDGSRWTPSQEIILEQDALKCLEPLLLSQWWKRVWVIQEVIVSQEAIFLSGNKFIKFDTLASAVQLIRQDTHLAGKAAQAIENLVWMRNRRKLPFKEGTKLEELLLRFRNQQASDPRDRIYGLLGLIDDNRDTPPISPDYTISMRTLYTNVASSIIKRDKDLGIIQFCSSRSQSCDLPSWVPDWSISLANQHSFGLKDKHQLRRAEYSSSKGFKCAPIIEGSSVEVCGFAIGRISQLAQEVTAESFNSGLGFSHILENLYEAYPSYAKYPPTRESLYIAFSRTLSCDLSWNGTRLRRGRSFLEICSPMFYDLPDDFEEGAGKSSKHRLDEFRRLNLRMVLEQNESRRFMMTSSGYMGLAPASALIGDAIYILSGSNFPVVLRGVDGIFMVVGVCYMHGFMDGEAMKGLESGKYTAQKFILV